MKRYEVAGTIRLVGERFGRIMECLHSEEYAAGYMQAVRDMVRIFEYMPVVEERPTVRRVVLFGGTKGRRHEGP